MNANLMKKKNFHLFYKVLLNTNVVFSFKTYFSFSFCSDFNLKTTVVKQTKLESQNNCLPFVFSELEEIFFSKIIINNYCIAHHQNHVKNNNDQTFQLTAAFP